MFQVFLSFKNSNDDGSPTIDSKMGEELYTALVKDGISVFFSNKTLPLLGMAQYKAAIDEALDEVEILVAIGTSKENLNSNWVRYEWDSFFNDILSEKKKGQVFSYIDDISPSELPRTLRQLQCFEKSKVQIDEIVRYIKNALRMENDSSKNIVPEKVNVKQKNRIFSTYSYLQNNEAKRLTSQAQLVVDNDIELLNSIIHSLSKNGKISVLDIGCANGYLTEKIFENFSDKIEVVLGIDHEQMCVNEANNRNKPLFKYELVELESMAFEEQLKSAMNKHHIEKFDLIFSSLVFHHLSDPVKTFVKLRKHLNTEGKLYIRTCDDDEIMGYPDEDNIISSTLQSTYNISGMSDRIHGKKIYSQLYKAGYKNIDVKPYYVTTAGMDSEKRLQFFYDIFYWRKNRYKYLLEKNPSDQKSLDEYNKYCIMYDEIEEMFLNPEFYFKVSGPIVIASK